MGREEGRVEKKMKSKREKEGRGEERRGSWEMKRKRRITRGEGNHGRTRHPGVLIGSARGKVGRTGDREVLFYFYILPQYGVGR
jgi:hypothetical protein